MEPPDIVKKHIDYVGTASLLGDAYWRAKENLLFISLFSSAERCIEIEQLIKNLDADRSVVVLQQQVAVRLLQSMGYRVDAAVGRFPVSKNVDS